MSKRTIWLSIVTLICTLSLSAAFYSVVFAAGYSTTINTVSTAPSYAPNDIGPVTASIDKTNYLPGEPVVMNLQFTPRQGFFVAYRLTNDQDYVADVYTGTDICAFCAGRLFPSPIPPGMIVISDAVQNPLTNFTLASSLPAGTYHLYVQTVFYNDTKYSWPLSTAIDSHKFLFAQSNFTNSMGMRYSWSTSGTCNFAFQGPNTAQSTTPGPSAVGGCASLWLSVNGGVSNYNMGHSQITFVVSSPTTNSFDFTLSNSGNHVVNPGSGINNAITGTISSGVARPVAMTVKSITNSSGTNVLNQVNGISASSVAFSANTIYPTQSTNLHLDTSASTPGGIYTVTVAGNAAAETGGTLSTKPAGTIYNCMSVAKYSSSGSQFDGETFGCDTASGFDPKAVPFSDSFIKNDDVVVVPGAPMSYTLSPIYKDWLVNLRAYNADYYCGKGNWSLYPTGASDYRSNTGFMCTASASAGSTTVSSAGALERTTTFTIFVDNYNLVAEKGADVCSAADAYTKLTWTRNPSATQYRLYKQNGANPETYVAVPQPSSGTTVTFYDPDSNLSNNTGLTVGDIYAYRVATNIGGVFQAVSPQAFAYPSSTITCPSNAITFTVGGGDITLKQGTSATINIPITLTSGGTQSVSLQFTPSNANITFSPASPSCSAISCVVTTTVTASAGAPVGATTFTVTGRSSSGTLATNSLIVRVTTNSNPYPVSSLSVIGPCSGDSVVNQSSVITFTTPAQADPDNDTVTYEYQTDNGSGYGISTSLGTTKYANVLWASTGTKKVRVRAVDSRGAYSPWVESVLSVRASCPGGGETTLISSCVSGFNTATKEAVWVAMARGGKAPYTYSWNGSLYADVSAFNTYLATVGATASAPVLIARDSAGSMAAAYPKCTDITRPGNSDPMTFTVSSQTVYVQRGASATSTVTIASTNGISKSVTLAAAQPINSGSGSAVTYITLTPNSGITCTTVIPDCSRDIRVSVDSVLGRTGTFTVNVTGTASSGETATGVITIIVTDKPAIDPLVNFTLSSGVPTCTSSSIIARWNKYNAASGYNLYRWRGTGSKIKLNNSPIPQPASGTIVTYTDNRVTANESYSYEVTEIINGVESTASIYSTRTAPAPTLATCPSGFGYSVGSTDFIARPGDTINITASVRLLLGTSRPINLTINQVVLAENTNASTAKAKITLLDKVKSALGISRTKTAHAADPYLQAKINGSAYCATIPCDIPLTITISPSADDSTYLVPLVAISDNNVTALGYSIAVVSSAQVTRVNTSSVVTLLDGMADCNNSSIIVRWTKDLNASGYYIYRTYPGSTVKTRVNETPIAQFSGATQTYFDTRLIPATPYTYEVRAIISGKESNPSPSATATTVSVPYMIGSCDFGMSVSATPISMKAGEEKTTNAVVVLNIGPSVDITLSASAVQFRPLISDASSPVNSRARTTASLSERILDFVGALPVKLNAAGTVTALIPTPVCNLTSATCKIPIRVTSSSDATLGTYSFPLSAVTNTAVPSLGVVTARGSLEVEIKSSAVTGCPPNCGGTTGTTFSFGVSATDVTVSAGQSISSQINVYTITPANADRSANVSIGTPVHTTSKRAMSNISVIPSTFSCAHTYPTCTQVVQITVPVGADTGAYTIPVLARSSTNETSQTNIALTVTDAPVTADSAPTVQMRAIFPGKDPIAWTSSAQLAPRRTSYLAPVAVDIEARKVMPSTIDLDKCYTTVENGTANWAQGSKAAPVSPALVLVRKTVSIAGSEKFSIFCKAVGSINYDISASISIDPINVPIIKEF